MNEHTSPMNPIESRETPEAVTATEPIAAQAAEVRTVTAEEAESVVPDAVKQSDTSRRAVEDKLASARARGVEWVGASDLLSRGTGRMAGAGIRFNQAAGARTRRGLASGVKAVSKRVRELPPVSAFGRRAASVSAASRSGVGMR
ncbi:MAG: hypothetical protein LKK45_02595 [Bifidobacterium psychraerophilum]|jgi:hypothetical protein|uniref:hypothetical protein n=1 Tax=Bifidobacterium psychraerophilum TaxID=218140 RepID=UPI0023F6C7D8|nr:hypothetical protein [Bifidobacterium psychraerophilum]MCI2176056.1 hypothetical protein [Bifidobacterium psychraerophilum]MCI2182842.1 hypothetical protein [Bifidobacterium psychraerophilum]